jgi:hypothetical protein
MKQPNPTFLRHTARAMYYLVQRGPQKTTVDFSEGPAGPRRRDATERCVQPRSACFVIVVCI